MGNFYVSMAVQTDDRDAVVVLLNNVPDAGVVAPAENGWVVFSTQLLETQDDRVIDEYGTGLSRGGASVLAILNHDDDLLMVTLYRGDRRIAHVVTDPGALTGEDLPPVLDGLEELASLNGTASAEAIREVLTSDEPFAVTKHAGLAGLLGLPAASVGFGHRYFEVGDFASEGYTRTGR